MLLTWEAMEGSGGVAEDATGTQQDETEMKISIKASAGGQRETQTVTASMSVAALKGDLEEAFGCRAQQMRLIYKGRVLQDANTLGSYGLQAEHTVHLVKSPTVPPSDKTQQGTGAAPTATAAGGGGGGTNSQARAAAPTQTGAAQGGSGAYHNDMAPDPGPAAMREMLGSPMFQVRMSFSLSLSLSSCFRVFSRERFVTLLRLVLFRMSCLLSWCC